ncbi:MAG: hypothetical protein KL863_05470 [Rhizobium sp.]|nr:hypothetical protein [Rhizobium sp.]MBX9455508.1 hypothetical protein [Rhizobium sp.]
MAKIAIKNDRTNPLDISTSNNTVTVYKGADFDSASYGIKEMIGVVGNDYVIDGRVSAKGFLDRALDISGTDATVTVGETGVLKSQELAIASFGDSLDIHNAGRIEGDEAAIGIAGNGSHLVNEGEIISKVGRAVDTHSISDFRLDNDGLMASELGLRFRVDGLKLDFGRDSVVEFGSAGSIEILSQVGWNTTISNAGEITNTKSGMINAIYGGDGSETIRNSGTITGFVWLEDGDDRYDGRGGRIREGTVNGGDGNDVYFLDDRRDKVHEGVGQGYDQLTVSFSYKLLSHAEFEEVRLAGSGNHRLTGNDMDNYLAGNKGDNRLVGNGGSDNFFGGAGKDVMTGGAGVDDFYFRANADREIVTDFTDGVDRIVHFAGKEITSVDDLLAHHVRQDGDDLIISGDGTEMILRNVDIANLTAADFTA